MDLKVVLYQAEETSVIACHSTKFLWLLLWLSQTDDGQPACEPEHNAASSFRPDESSADEEPDREALLKKIIEKREVVCRYVQCLLRNHGSCVWIFTCQYL